jgi:hypothetical protein
MYRQQHTRSTPLASLAGLEIGNLRDVDGLVTAINDLK